MFHTLFHGTFSECFTKMFHGMFHKCFTRSGTKLMREHTFKSQLRKTNYRTRLSQSTASTGREQNKCVLSKGKFSRANRLSVPFWGPLEANLDGLFWIGDVEPAAVSVPAFGDHLNEHASQRRVRNMGDAV